MDANLYLCSSLETEKNVECQTIYCRSLDTWIYSKRTKLNVMEPKGPGVVCNQGSIFGLSKVSWIELL